MKIVYIGSEFQDWEGMTRVRPPVSGRGPCHTLPVLKFASVVHGDCLEYPPEVEAASFFSSTSSTATTLTIVPSGI